MSFEQKMFSTARFSLGYTARATFEDASRSRKRLETNTAL